MTTTENAVEQAERLIRLLIDEIAVEPKKIRIESERFGLSSTVLSIYADQTDYGKILGGQQAHLRAFKTICSILSEHCGTDIQLQLVEVPGGTRALRAPFAVQEDWPREHVRELLQEVFGALLYEPCRVTIEDGRNGLTAIEVVASSIEREQLTSWLVQKMGCLVRAIGLKHGRQVSFNIIRDSALLESGLVGGPSEKARWAAPDPMDLRGFIKSPK